MSHLEEIKSRLSIEELVGNTVQLKKAGRNLRGLCPFHNEKTPSFMVSPEKQIAYCFGCNQGGDIFKFTQLVENIDFGEAVRLLAERTHVTLPRIAPGWQDKRLQMFEMNRMAVIFFQDQLRKNKPALDYFKSRKLTDETIERFQLGYAPDSFTALKDHLMGKDFSDIDLIEAGLLNQRSMADKNSYDRFRNRLIFPIFDHQGNPIAFGGRIIGEGEPKYLNSPDTPVYNKSLTLYGLHFAKEIIKKEDMTLVTEGYMDVIAAHQAGTVHTVATSGTALTSQQLKLMKRYSKKVAFAFDRDTAGLQASMRAIELAQHAELEVYIIPIPEGKDPDECIRSNPVAWKAAITDPLSVMDFYFHYAESTFNADELAGKKSILELILPLIKQYGTQMEQEHHLKRLALFLKTDIALLWNDLKRVKLPSQSTSFVPAEPVLSRLVRPSFGRECFLLGFILQWPALYGYVQEHLIDNIPFDSATEPFYNACKIVYKQESAITVEAVKLHLTPENIRCLDIYHLLIEEHYPDFSDMAAEREVRHLVRSINQANLRRVQKEYEFKIRAASAGDKKLLLNQYNEILKLMSRI